MKALITGTPMQIEGEPAEIAQLVELLSSGAVMVEHVHHWRLELPDDEGLQQGRCWCSATKTFAPWADVSNKPSVAKKSDVQGSAPQNVVATPRAKVTRKGTRWCGYCHQAGHQANRCPAKMAA